MFGSRWFQLLLLAVAVLSVTQAAWWDASIFNSRSLSLRQDGGDDSTTGDDGSNSPGSPGGTDDPDDGSDNSGNTDNGDDSTDAPGSTPTGDGDTTSSPPPDTTTTSPTETPPSTTPPTTTTQDQSTSTPTPPSTTSEPPESTTSDEQPSTSSEESQTTKTTPKPTISTSTEVVTKTNADGSKVTTTSATEVTTTPGLGDDDGSGSSGMSTKTRNTIIGVVVGVGGAIVLGALALVAFRIWGRKKRAEENDGLMAYDASYNRPGSSPTVPDMSVTGSPDHSTSTRTPFQSTLENYHQPGNVTASSNF